jgi:hypothetical protein
VLLYFESACAEAEEGLAMFYNSGIFLPIQKISNTDHILARDITCALDIRCEPSKDGGFELSAQFLALLEPASGCFKEFLDPPCIFKRSASLIPMPV